MTWDVQRFQESISDAVLPDLDIERGIAASRTGIAPQAGRMTVTMDRDELAIGNQARLYDDQSIIWTGYVRDVQQTVDRRVNGLRWQAYVSGAIADLVATRAGAFTPVYESITIDQAIINVLNAIGWPQTRRRIAVSQRVLAWWWLPADVAPWNAILDLVNTDGPTARFFENSSGELEFVASRSETASAESTLYGRTESEEDDAIVTRLENQDDGLDRVINEVDIPYARRANLGESSIGTIDWGTYDLSAALVSTARVSAASAAIGDRILAISAHAAFASGDTSDPRIMPPDGLSALYEEQESQSLGATTDHQQDINVSTEESSVGERSGGTTLVNRHQDVTIRTGSSYITGTLPTSTSTIVNVTARGAAGETRMHRVDSATQGGAGTGSVTIPNNAINIRVTVRSRRQYRLERVVRRERHSTGLFNAHYAVRTITNSTTDVGAGTSAPSVSRNGNTITVTPAETARTISPIYTHTNIVLTEYDVTVRVSWQTSTTLPVTDWRSRFALATDPNTLPVGAAATQWRRVQGGAGSGMVTIPDGATNIRVTITALSRRWVRYDRATAGNRASTSKGSENVLSTASSHVSVRRSGNTITVTPVTRSGTTAYQSPSSVVGAGSVSSYVATIRVQWQQSTQPRTWSLLHVTHGTAPAPSVNSQTEYSGTSDATRRTTSNLAMLPIRNVAEPRVVQAGDSIGAGTVLISVLLVESRLDNPPRVSAGSGWTVITGAPTLNGGTPVVTGAGRILYISTRRLDTDGTVPASGWSLQSGTQPQNAQLRSVIIAFAVDREEVWRSSEELTVGASSSLDVDVLTDGPIYDLITPVEDYDYSVISGSLTAVTLHTAPRPGSVIRLTAGDEGAIVKGLRLRGVAVIGGLTISTRDAASILEHGLQHPASIGTWPWVDRETALSIGNDWIADRGQPLAAWDIVLDGDRNAATRAVCVDSDIGSIIRTLLDDEFDRSGEVLAIRHAISNPAGNLRTILTFLAVTPTVLAAPGVPRSLTTTAVTGSTTQLDVDWRAPSTGGAVATYRVRWRRQGTSNWSERTTTGNSVRLSSLGTSTTYEVQVRAENATGNSDYTASVTGTTNTPVQAPGIPTSVVAAPGNGRITLTWEAPSTGGTVEQYRVEWSNRYANPSADDRSFTITGLTNGTAVTVRIRAENSGGDSAYVTVSATPVAMLAVPGVPTSLQAVAGDGEVTLSWSAPSSGGAVATYEVQHRTGSGSWTEVTGITGTSHTVTGLTNGTSYQFQVRARNASGASAWTASQNATPQVSAPGVPTNVNVDAGNAQLVVTWSAPSSGGAVATYTVEYRLADQSPEESFGDAVTAAARSQTITGLTNDETYDVRVRANNAAGSSAWVQVDDVTPEAGLVGPVLILARTIGTIHQITWTYSPPAGYTASGRYDSELGRQYTSSVVGRTTFAWGDLPVTNNSHTFRWLQSANLTRLEFRVRAYVTPTDGQETKTNWSTIVIVPAQGQSGEVIDHRVPITLDALPILLDTAPLYTNDIPEEES